MRQIELVNGYMVCIACRGFIFAGNKQPVCECLEAVEPEEEVTYN